MSAIISLIVLVIVLGVVFWATRTLLAAFKVPEPASTVIVVLLVIVAIAIVLQAFGVWPGETLRLPR